jgi:hypothetical protein
MTRDCDRAIVTRLRGLLDRMVTMEIRRVIP